VGRKRLKHAFVPGSALGLLLAPALVLAQTAPPPAPVGPGGAKEEDNPTGWTAKAGLSYVQTSGNSKTSTLGFKLGASYNWTKTFFNFQASGIQASTTNQDSFAVGPSDSSFVVVQSSHKETTAENYALDASLDHNLSKRFFWQAGAGWLRNTFAGIESREAARAGTGYIFTDPGSKGTQFKSALLLTLTHQSLTIPDPRAKETFVGLRAFADLLVPFGSSSFVSRASFDQNLQVSEDSRLTWWNSLGVTLTGRLGLQVSLLLFFNNLPALQQIPLYETSPGGIPVPPPIGSVMVPLGKWDNELSVSFVLNIAPKKPTPKPVGAP
jgi:hypothetical protein